MAANHLPRRNRTVGEPPVDRSRLSLAVTADALGERLTNPAADPVTELQADALQPELLDLGTEGLLVHGHYGLSETLQPLGLGREASKGRCKLMAEFLAGLGRLRWKPTAELATEPDGAPPAEPIADQLAAVDQAGLRQDLMQTFALSESGSLRRRHECRFVPEKCSETAARPGQLLHDG